MNKEALENAGMNVGAALERVMGSEALLEQLLGLFLKDPNFGKLKDAMAAHDEGAAIEGAHALKGICGNLSLDRLHELAATQLACLREGRWDDAAALMPQIEEAYRLAHNAISRG